MRSKHTDKTVTPAASNYNKGRAGVKVDRIVLHHQAGYSATTLSMMSTGSRKVSANYVVNSDGSVVSVVDENDTPFTNGNLAWNRRSVTFEIENSKPKVGKPTPEAHEAVAQVVADIAKRYGIPLTRDAVLTHRELYTKFKVGYATACPGELDRDWIITRAQAINAATPAGGVTEEEEEDDMAKVNTGISYTDKDGVRNHALINTNSGFLAQWIGGDGAHNNGIAAAFDTGSFAQVSESVANRMIAAAARVQPTRPGEPTE